MPEPRGEAAAQGSPRGFGKQWPSRVPVEPGAPPFSGTDQGPVCAIPAQGSMWQPLGHGRAVPG